MSRLKHAFRTLLKTPSVTLIAIVSLALGIGSTTAIFSIFDQMVLRPLPVENPAQLVNLKAPGPKPGSQSCGNAGDCDSVFSYPMFRDLERAQTVFTGIAAHCAFGTNLSYRGQTMSGEGELVSGSYFSVLGLHAALGRLLGPGDERATNQSPVAVLSHAYWESRFQASPAVVNDTIIVNGQALTIVGVAPAGFEGTTLGDRPDVYVPITMRGVLDPQFKGFENRRTYWIYLFARLKPGVAMQQASAGINAPYHGIINDVEVPLQQGMSPATMARFKAREVRMDPGARGQSTLHDDARAPLTLLLGVTGLVLLIACANIANLLLARAAGRTGEMAVRLSIGASRRQLIAQLLTESILLAIAGGAAAMIVAHWTVDLVASLLPADQPLMLQFSLNPKIMFFAAALTLGAGVLFGLFPALHSTKPDVISALKGQTGQPSGARSAARFRMALATAQIALSMTLLISAGLFTRSLFNVSRVDLGLKIDRLITFGLSPGLNGYAPLRSRTVFMRVEDDIRALPGVSGVTVSKVPLLSGSNWGSSVSVEGFSAGPDTDTNSRYNEVGPGYFQTMGIPLIGGREFTDSDISGAPKVAIVNEQFAKKFNLGHDVIGKHMKSGEGDPATLDIEIVGLVRNARYSEVKQDVPPLFFRPYRQDDTIGSMTVYVRASSDAEKMMSAIQPVISKIDPTLPVEGLRTMEQQVETNVAVDRVLTILSASFASLATLLAAIGLYGVLAFTVAQRTREFGLRMALGADPSQVRGMVLRQVCWMTLIGGAIGIAGAVGLGHLAESLLFEIKGHDPLVFAASALLLSAIAILSGFIPAHRASRVDPMKALRYE